MIPHLLYPWSLGQRWARRLLLGALETPKVATAATGPPGPLGLVEVEVYERALGPAAP